MIIVSTVVTAIRNVALVVFTVEVCWLAWRMLAAGAGPPPLPAKSDRGRIAR